MTTYIRNPQRVTNLRYTLFFESVYRRGSGYMFDCDADGKVDVSALTEAQRKSWDDAQGNEYLPVQRTIRNSYFDSGSVRCNCGHEHNLDRHDSACEVCGKLYNAVGQQLRPRHEWQEDY